MSKTGYTAKVEEETRDRIKAIEDAIGGTQEAALLALLDAYERVQETEGLEVPSRARKEVHLFVKSLQGGIDLLMSAITMAEAEVVQVKEESQTRIGKALEEVQGCKDELVRVRVEKDERDEDLKEARERIEELAAALGQAQSQAESLDAVKAAWREREAELNARIVDLQADRERLGAVKEELAGARDELATVREEMTGLVHAHELRVRDLEADKAQALHDIQDKAQEAMEKALEDLAGEYEARVQELAATKADADVRLARAEAEARSGAERIEDIKATLSDVRASLARAEARAEKAEARVEKVEAEKAASVQKDKKKAEKGAEENA